MSPLLWQPGLTEHQFCLRGAISRHEITPPTSTSSRSTCDFNFKQHHRMVQLQPHLSAETPHSATATSTPCTVCTRARVLPLRVLCGTTATLTPSRSTAWCYCNFPSTHGTRTTLRVLRGTTATVIPSDAPHGAIVTSTACTLHVLLLRVLRGPTVCLTVCLRLSDCLTVCPSVCPTAVLLSV